jgi:predicted SnoaL-like aldol condensation-catalyzing enzyme
LEVINVKNILAIALAIIVGALSSGGNAMAQTTQQANKELIGNFAEEVFVNKSFANLSRYMRADYIQHNPLVAQGSSGFQEFFQSWFASAPDFRYTLKNIVADGDYVWVYGTYSGTQTGDWLGIPATNKAYGFDAVDIFRVSDGKLAEHWDVLDTYGLFKQLGTIQ